MRKIKKFPYEIKDVDQKICEELMKKFTGRRFLLAVVAYWDSLPFN